METPDKVINSAVYADGVRVSNVDIADVNSAIRDENHFVWIGLHEPGNELLSKLQKELGLHELAIEDAHKAHQRPKLETYGDTLFIVLRTAQIKDKRVDLGETHFFIGSSFIVSVRHGSSLQYVDVRSRCESTPALLKKGPGFALYALMDAVVDQYFPVIDALEQELVELEKKIFHEKFRKETTVKRRQVPCSRMLLQKGHASGTSLQRRATRRENHSAQSWTTS